MTKRWTKTDIATLRLLYHLRQNSPGEIAHILEREIKTVRNKASSLRLRPLMREKLPNRRPAEIFEVEWHGTVYECSVGFYRTGHPGEVFIRGGKDGSDLMLLIDDVSVLLSLLLQFGVKPSLLFQSLGRLSEQTSNAPSDVPSSILGHIIREIARYEVPDA